MTIYDLSSILFFAVPALVAVFFLTSLILFIIAKVKNKKAPGTYSARQVTTRLVLLIISAALLGILVAMTIGIIALLGMIMVSM